MIDVSYLTNAQLLCALVEGKQTQGLGFINHNRKWGMVEALELTKDLVNGKSRFFDYVNGVCVKVEIGGDTIDPWLYDRDRYPGACQAAVDSYLDKLTPPSGVA